ncbi:VOC family protein [Actinoplanes solisilvae]|uniref:VOC family protein n=1 Tax=Actinoplanes solisilvae TaxID=2486853 RepID=UPI001F0C9336|nr:VOC family protein [Actinoplanes solisilvae]
MANQTGRPIAPARKLVAAVAGTIAVFVVALGFGMSNLGVVIFGVALLGLAVALGMVNVVRRGARAWVSGTAEVRAITPRPMTTSVYARARIQAVIVAPGLPTNAVEINESRIPLVKWPEPGDTLPITVDVDDMRRVKINWDDAAPRERGEDPPPPPVEFDDEPDADLDADLLGDVEPPPWATRDRSWGRGPDEPPPPPPGSSPPPATPPPSPPGNANLDSEEYSESPVVVRDTPAGPVVEGEFVDHDEKPSPLPRRASAAGSDAPSDAEPVPPADSGPGSGSGSGRDSYSGPGDRPTGEPAGAAQAAREDRPTAGPGTSAPKAPDDRPSASAYTAPDDRSNSANTAPRDRPNSAYTAPDDRPVAEPEGRLGAAGAAAAGAAVGAAAGFAAGKASRRPSPRPRSGAATATAEPETITGAPSGPPSQREPHPDDSLVTDLPLDEPSSPYRRPEPTATSAPATPSPVGSFPTAPPPARPRPTAPEPATAHPAAATSAPKPRSADDEIDLPLDSDPDPAPETTPAAAEALEEDLIAPPPRETPIHPSTHFVSNAAHDATTRAEAVPEPEVQSEAAAPEPGKSGGRLAGAFGAVAAAVAAVKKAGRNDEPSRPAAVDEPSRPAPVDDDKPSASAPVDEESSTPEPRTAASARPPETSSSAESAGTPGPEPTTVAEASPASSHPKPSPAAAALAAAAAAAAGDRGPWADLAGVSEPDDRTADVITAYPSARPGPAGAIHGVGITVLVTDLARSTAFYRETLGFFEIDSGEGSAVLASGDTRLVLRVVHDLSAEAGRLIYLNLEVGDVEAVYEELRAKGIEFVHAPRPVNRGDRLELWSATFRDPDDHNIAITQWRAIH